MTRFAWTSLLLLGSVMGLARASVCPPLLFLGCKLPEMVELGMKKGGLAAAGAAEAIGNFARDLGRSGLF